MNQGRDIDDAVMWLELAARVTRLPATALLARLREGDDDLADAILAILYMGLKPSLCLDAMRDFLVQQSLGETWDPATDVLPSTSVPETSPFQVPQRFLDLWTCTSLTAASAVRVTVTFVASALRMKPPTLAPPTRGTFGMLLTLRRCGSDVGIPIARPVKFRMFLRMVAIGAVYHR